LACAFYELVQVLDRAAGFGPINLYRLWAASSAVQECDTSSDALQRLGDISRHGPGRESAGGRHHEKAARRFFVCSLRIIVGKDNDVGTPEMLR